jgi:hypothetical protein
VSGGNGYNITSLKVTATGLPKGELPVAGGIRISLPEPPGLLEFQYEFGASDDASVLPDDATAEAVIDGVAIDAAVTAGMSPADVAYALYGAMVSAGVPDAYYDGNTVSFSEDTAGSQAQDVNLTFVGEDGSPVSWIYYGVNFAGASG